MKKMIILLTCAAMLSAISGCGKSKAQVEADRQKQEAASRAAIERERAAAVAAKEAAEKRSTDNLLDMAKRNLKDPASAQFRDVKYLSEKEAVCGEVNAKNDFGGYMGFRPFTASNNGAIIWNGGGCTRLSTTSAVSACQEHEIAFARAAIANGCKTQAELNATIFAQS